MLPAIPCFIGSYLYNHDALCYKMNLTYKNLFVPYEKTQTSADSRWSIDFDAVGIFKTFQLEFHYSAMVEKKEG